MTPLQEKIEEEIRNICTYWSEPDEISGKETAGTAGYCLTEEQFEKLFTLFRTTVYKMIVEDCIKLSDEVEGRYADSELNEWRAFKAFRNELRDHLTQRLGEGE